MTENLEKLVGSKVQKIRMNEDFLVFETDKGIIAFSVDGDCCSHSYFYDFHGVEKLLKGNPVIEVKSVPLEADEKTTVGQDVVQVYGYQITTHDEKWGDVTSVFSFRNESNGYYGGSLENAGVNVDPVPEITKDTTL